MAPQANKQERQEPMANQVAQDLARLLARQAATELFIASEDAARSTDDKGAPDAKASD